MSELNVRPGTLFIEDNLKVLRGINDECIDLVYLDPPFHANRDFVAPLATNKGVKEQRFSDVWHPSKLKDDWIEGVREIAPKVYAVCEAARVAVGPDRWAYLIFMAVRLMEIHRVLKPTGSCWLHCDWHADGWLRTLMDAIFGAERIRCSVAWCYTGPGSPKMKQFNRKHDTLLWYVRGSSWTFNGDAVRVPHADGGPHAGGFKEKDGTSLDAKKIAMHAARGKLPETWWSEFTPVGRLKNERTGWSTQKPVRLLERIVLACSNEGDVVLDPFCGCATTMVAAQKLGRRWLGIDCDPVAQGITLGRMRDEAGLFDAPQALQVLPNEVPDRTDGGLHACEALELEFELTKQRAELLNGPQKAALRRQLWAEMEGKCQGLRYADGSHVPCLHGGIFMPIEFFELDHIQPRAKGGVDRLDNLQLGCASCNAHKAAHLKPPKKRSRK